MKTIKITGIGTGSVEANQIELSILLETLKKDYEQAISDHSKRLNDLVSLITACGFKNSDVKTDSFRVNPKYNTISTLKGTKQALEGYQVVQYLTIKFPLDMPLLDKLITSISKSDINPKTNVNFTIKEKEAFQNKLLENACVDAKNKAEILASCTNQKIIGINSIDYSFSRVNIYSKTKYSCESYDSVSSISKNLTPSDIQESIEATFVFEVE